MNILHVPLLIDLILYVPDNIFFSYVRTCRPGLNPTPILNYVFFLSLGTASRRPNEKHRSPLLVQADQSLSTLTAMVHAGMSDVYYFGKASRTDHHSPAKCSLTQFLIFGCLLPKNSQTQFFYSFHSGDKMFL